MASDTITRAVLRARLLEQVGQFISSTTTSGGSNSTLVDTEIQKFNTDRLNNKWILVTSGDAAGEERRVSSISTSTITAGAPVFSATIATSVTYEIMPWRPADVHRALEHGIRTVAPLIYVRKQDETLVVDNLLSNWDFESFSTANTPDNWTLTNLSAGTTITEDNTRVFQGTSSIKCAPTAGDATARQDVFNAIEVNDASGKTLHVRAWAWYDGSGTVKARVSFDNGSTFTDSSDHSGESEWELLDIDVTIPSTATTAIVYLFTGNNQTAYWDYAVAWVGPLTRYTVPSDIISLRQVRQQENENDPIGPFEPLGKPVSGRILRLIGLGRLTVPSTDAATLEADDEVAEAIVARAAMRLFVQQAANDPGNRDEHLATAGNWAREYRDLVDRGTLRSPHLAADSPLANWHPGEDSSGRYLYLER